MPKFSAEITLGVNQSDVKNAQKGFMAIGSSVEHAGSLVKKLKADNDTATAAISQRVLEAVGSYGKLEKAVEAGSKSAVGQLKRTTDAVEDLERHIRAARMAGAPVDPEAEEVLEVLRNRTKQLNDEMGRQAALNERVNRELDDSTRKAGAAGKGFNSISDILGVIHPQAETAALGIGMYWGALKVVERGANDVADAMGHIGKAFGVSQDVVADSVDQMKSRIKTLLSMGPQMLLFAEIVKKIRGAASFGNVTGGSSSLGGKDLALAEMSAEFQQLEQDTATFLERMQALEAAGRLNADSIKANAGAADSLAKRYHELGREIPVAVRGFVSEEKAVKKLAREVKEMVRMKLDYDSPASMLAGGQASIEAAIKVTDVAFEKAAHAGILKALGKIKQETIHLAFSTEELQQAKGINAPRSIAAWVASEQAKIRNLYEKGLIDQEHYAAELVDIQREGAMAGLDAVQGVLGSLSQLGSMGSSPALRSFQQAIGQVQAAFQFGQQAQKAASSMGASASTASALGTVGTVFAIFYVIYDAVSNYIKKKKLKQFGNATEFGIVGGDVGTTELQKFSGKVTNVIRETIRALEQALLSAIDFLPTIAVRARADGKKFEASVGDMFIGIFDSMEDAISAATAYAIKNATFVGLDPIVQAALNKTTADTMEELQAGLAAAVQASQAAFSGGHVSFLNQLAGLDAVQHRMIELLGPTFELADAIRNETVAKRDAIKAERARLLGIQQIEDFTKRLTDAQSFNIAIEKERARILAEIAKLEQQMAAAQQQANRPGFSGGLGGSDGSGGSNAPGGPGRGNQLPSQVLEAQYAIQALLDQLAELDDVLSLDDVKAGIKNDIFGVLYGYLEGNKKYAKEILEWKKKELDVQFQQYKLQLITLGMWDAATEALWNAARDAALKALGNPGGRGGNRQADRQGVVDALRDYDLSKLGAAQRGLADINKKWDDHAKAAHGNAALLAQIAAARRDEIALMLKQLALGLRRDVGDFLGRGGALGGALRGIDENAQGLIDRARDLMKAGKMTKDEFLRLRDTIRDAQAQQRQSMVQNAANSLFQELYGLLGMDKEAAQLKYDLTVAELHVKLEELKIAVKKYELEGKFIPGLEDLIKRVEAAGPGIFSGGSGGAVGTFDVTDIQTAIQQRMATALEMLRRYQGQNGTGNSAFMQELARVQQDFVQIREGLGNTLEVQTAYAAAIRDVITRFLDPVRDQLREMQYGEASVLSPLEQFQSIFAEAQAAAARFAAGDLSVVETAPQLIQQLLALAGQAMPQGGAGYRSVYEWAQAFLNQMLGLQNAPLNPQGIPVPGPAPVFPVGTATFPGTTSAQILGTINNQGAVRPVTDAIVGARDMQIVELRAIRAAVERQANATERMERFRGVAWQVA